MGQRRNKHHKCNSFAQKKRERREKANKNEERRPHEPYNEIIRENESFIKYYKHQKVCPEAEWEQFLTAIKANLPTTFRVTGSRGEAKALLDIIRHDFFEDYIKGAQELQQADDGASGSEPIEFHPPLCLPWYPDGLAWQLQLTRKDIRRSEHLFRLHNFLIAETSAGGISRQEAVSMIPPIVLDVKPHHKVLDMCAAPGSKTAQLIESLHSGDDLPTGFVIANDVDNNRCYMLVHQAKRLNSPCFLVTNHDSSNYPNFEVGANGETLKFDRILCDVPCSGDGTLRKNPDIWQKWNATQGLGLHGIQYRIAKRGAELLEIGGRLVYSTCSLNPLENECVLFRLVKESEGALEIVNATDLVPGLKYYPGMTYWQPASRDLVFYDKFEDVPERWITTIRPQMFPPSSDEEGKQYGLDKCLRILPHLQDSGAFFVAALIKKKKLPWEKDVRAPAVKRTEDATSKTTEETPSKTTEETKTETTGEQNSKSEEQPKSAPWGPQRKRKRIQGYKEDPFVFFGEEEAPIWESIKTFYNIDDAFKSTGLLTRCIGGKKKNIYFCSEPIRNLVIKNEHLVKIINTGVKAFARCDNKNMKCAFRLAQEGLPTTNVFIGKGRRIYLEKEDLITLLQNTDPLNPPQVVNLSEKTQSRVEEVPQGSCVLHYVDEKLALTLVGWRGTQSLRAYIDTNETIHMLRLLGADLSKYDINKFRKNEADTAGGQPDEVKADADEDDEATSPTNGKIAKLEVESEDVEMKDEETVKAN